MDKTKSMNSTFNDSLFDTAASNHSHYYSIFRVINRSIITSHNNNDRPAHIYHKVEDTIKHLCTLHQEDDDYVSPEAAHRALIVLRMLRHASVPAPRIIPGEDGEDVTFTWDSEEMKKFLTVTMESFNVTKLHRPSKQREFKKYISALDSPNDVLLKLGEPARYSSRVTSD